MPEVTGQMFIDTPDPQPLQTAYGAFMLAVAIVEHDIHDLFCSLTGVTENIAKLLFSDTTIGDELHFLKTLIKLSDLPEEGKEHLHEIRIQYKAINGMRNKLVHQYNITDRTATKLKSLDLKAMVFPEALIKAVEYELESLWNAYMDLNYMNEKLELFVVNIRAKNSFKLPYEEALSQPFCNTWLYIAPVQHQQGHADRRHEQTDHIPK
jgi:hypothetical protein